MKEVVGLLDRHGQFFLAAEDDILFLHVRGKTVGHKVFPVRAGTGLVSPGQPGIESAAYGPVGDVDDVTGRPHDNTLAAGIGAAAHGDDAWNGSHVGGQSRGFILQGLVDHYLFGAFAGYLGRILLDQLRLDIGRLPLHHFLFRCCCHVGLLI